MAREGKSSKARQSKTIASPPSPPARQFYDITELRSRLFFFLSSHDLATFARVEKKGLNEVAKALYRRVTYHKARTMGGSTATQRLYRDAVTEIDARGRYLCLTDSILQKLDTEFESGRGKSARIEAYLAEYRIDVFKAVVPPLLEKLPCLRRITFGSEYQAFGTHSWVVKIDPRLGDAEHGGIIDLITTFRSTPRSVPSYLVPYSAPPNYILRHRFDLNLFRDDCDIQSTPDDAARWVSLLRDDPSYAGLYKAIDLSDLTVTLDDITGICQRQVNSSYSERLEVIIANCVLPWTVDDLSQFALISSSSLTHLLLASRYSTIKRRPPPPHQPLVSFSDLRTIKAIIKGNFPNLEAFSITLTGAETAEAECWDMIKGECQEDDGTIHDLQINTDSPLPQVLNVIRALLPLCALGGKVRVGPAPTVKSCTYSYSDEPVKKFDIVSVEQTKFLRFIQQQTLERRKHLSHIDFSLLDVSTFPQVFAITYDLNDRPQRRGFDAAARWLVDAMTRRARLTQTGRHLTSAQQWCMDAARRLVKLSPTSALQEMLQEARRMIRVSEGMDTAESGEQSGSEEMEEYTMAILLEMQDHMLAMEYLADKKRQ